MLRNLLITIACCFLCHSLAHAQYFERTAGLRMGHTSGLCYKFLLDEEDGIELMLAGRDGGLQVLGLYEHHQLIQTNGPGSLFFYYGGGLHLGAIKTDIVYSAPPDPISLRQEARFVMGADAIVGLSYRFHGLPLVLSYDIKPYFDHIGLREFNFRFWDTGFTVRYVLR